jgi:hypothetical protein
MSPNAGGRGGVAESQLYTGAQLNFGDLMPYLTYGKCVKTIPVQEGPALPHLEEKGPGHIVGNHEEDAQEDGHRPP